MLDNLHHILTNEKLLRIIAAVIFVLCLWTVAAILRRGRLRAGRVKALQTRIQGMHADMIASLDDTRRQPFVDFMRSAATALKLTKPGQTSKAEAMLSEAGIYSRDARYVLASSELMLPILFGMLAFIGVMTFHPAATSHQKLINYLIIVLAAYIGVKLPAWYVRYRRSARYYRIRRALPDMLDLMTISAEAGLSLAAAMDCVSRELAAPHPELAEELKITSAEGNLLAERNQALVNWTRRCKLPEIQGIVSVLVQTEKFGTPIVQALRVLASEFRQARMLAAEQKAMRLPVLMTVPMMLCILPTLFIIILTPAAMKLMDTFHHRDTTHSQSIR